MYPKTLFQRLRSLYYDNESSQDHVLPQLPGDFSVCPVGRGGAARVAIRVYGLGFRGLGV